MSCNGCRVLRKGCSESCILRPCLQWIATPEAQGHATVFVAKFFGRAGLSSFISAVPESERPGLFQSLLFEACGRTVNPVTGAVGLLGTGNWKICQAAVETVLRGGTLRPIPDLVSSSSVRVGGESLSLACDEDNEDCKNVFSLQSRTGCRFSSSRSTSAAKRKRSPEKSDVLSSSDLDLCLVPSLQQKTASYKVATRRQGTHSMESVTTAYSGMPHIHGSQEMNERKLLNLFV